MVFDGYKYNRDQVFSALAENKIIARKYFYPLTSSFACYAGRPGFNPDDTPVAKRIAASVLCLPIYAGIEESVVNEVCDIILG